MHGEGEYVFLELINKIEMRKNIYNTQNFWFKRNQKIIKNPLRPLVQNLDEISFPIRKVFI